MRPTYREVIFALVMAGTLSLSLAAGAAADRGGGHGGRDHAQQPGTPITRGLDRSSKGSGHAIGRPDNDESTATPTGTTTPATATPTNSENEDRGNHGEEVSEAAHQIAPGPEHGEDVSEIARENNGQENHAGDVDDTVTATGTPPTATATVTGTPPTATATATATETPTVTDTATATNTATATDTDTATVTATVHDTATPTATFTATATDTPDDGDSSDAAPHGRGLFATVVTYLSQSLGQLLSSV